jgi:tetratricopeptide (TPR) repeat protein
VDINPNFTEARCNLGSACTRLNRLDEAIAQYQKALDIQPDYAKVCGNLGNVLVRLGRFGEALAQFRRAVELKPDDADAQNNLAWLLATCPVDSLRNGAAAIEHAQRANQLCGGRRADVLGTLAAAYAEAGRFPEALAASRKALELATQQNHRAWVAALRARIALYEAGKPFRQVLPAPASSR